MTVEAVRDLHAPQPDHGRLICRGCDADGYEAEDPEWPCRTADLVYTSEEILDATDAAKWEYRWRSAMERRNRSLAPRLGFSNLIAAAYSKQLDFMLRSQPLMKTLADQEPATTVTLAEYGNAIKVSKQLMEDS